MEKKDWKKKLRELSFMKGYYFKLEDNGLVEKKDDQLVFNRKDLEDFISSEIEKAREEGIEEGERSKSIEISGYFSQTEGEHLLERGKGYVIISREEYDNLSKLKDNK